MLKSEAMRLPSIFRLASLFTGVMVGVTSMTYAGEYEDARTLLVAQRWAEALPLLKELSEEEPNSVTVAQDLAQVLLRLNRREEALELLKKHKLNRPAEIAARSFLSKESFRLYQQGLDWLVKRAYSQACERFERALEKDQAHLDILLRLAQCEVLDGNAELAIKNFDQLERIHGKNPETQIWRARAGALRGRYDEALLIFNSVSAGGKAGETTSELLPLWWGEALLAAGKKGAALIVFDADARRFPTHLQTSLAAIRIRVSQAESENQILAVERDLAAWEKLFTLPTQTKKKHSPDFVLNPFDPEVVQRVAIDTRRQIKQMLPTPTPTPTTPSPLTAASKH